MTTSSAADIERALTRFDDVMGGRHPACLEQLRPGLDDEGVSRLREAVAPFLIPEQVGALYRWHDGGDSGVFGGWRMRPIEELLDWYRATCDVGSPRSWLPVFDDQIVNVVTLDLPGHPPSDGSVWFGHTHDAWLERLFDSVAALLHVVCDAAEGGLFVEEGGRLGLRDADGDGDGAASLDGLSWNALRLARCPGAFDYPDPPDGTYLSRFPEPTWPHAWLEPLGITDASLALREPTHTIAELIAAAARGPISGTIRGRVVTGGGGAGFWNPVVDDGSGRLIVACDTTNVPLQISVGSDGEFDVLLEDASAPEPISHEDPLVIAVADRLRPALPTARALAARPLTAGD